MGTWKRRTSALALALAASAAACDDGTGVGSLGDLDPAAVEADLDALITPLRRSIEPSAALEGAFQDLIRDSVSFDRPPGPGGAWAGLVPFDHGRAATEFPPELQGSTYIYDSQQQRWRVDSTRTGAPDAGIRVIWYTTDPSGSLLVPLEERGYIDLTDEDTADQSRLGVVMVETAGDGDVILTDYQQGYGLDDGEDTSHAEAAGSFGDGDVTVNFDLTTDVSGSQDTGDLASALVIHLNDDPADYTLDIDAAAAAGSDQVEQDVVATVVRDGVTTELALEFLFEGGEQSGSGTLSHAGELIVDVAVDGNRFTYTDPDGLPISSGDAAAVDSLVRSLFLTGLDLVTVLPLLF